VNPYLLDRRTLLRAGLFGGVMIFVPQFGRFFRETQPATIAVIDSWTSLGGGFYRYELLNGALELIQPGQIVTLDFP